jgi:hypothetical protein
MIRTVSESVLALACFQGHFDPSKPLISSTRLSMLKEARSHLVAHTEDLRHNHQFDLQMEKDPVPREDRS